MCIRDSSECADGIDNDADGVSDVADPGCMSLSDNDEAPDPSPVPECADGMDNDGNGLIDFPQDLLGCSRASDGQESNCGDADPTVLITTAVTTGNTDTAANDSVPSCNGTNSAPDIAHGIVFPGALSSLNVNTITSTTTFDTVLSMRPDDCLTGLPEVCDDDSDTMGSGTQSELILSSVAAGLYFIYVDGFGSTNSGDYVLNISGVIAPGQACDAAQVTAGIVACTAGETCTAGVCQ